jgi:mRNA-degrading endonuclease RelE of RelBE toxin-antitoxin system
MYTPAFDENWPAYFEGLDKGTRERVAKKIKKIIRFPYKKHLKGRARFFADEVGQYRIIYRVFEEDETVVFYFIGNHKDYTKWYGQLF